MIGTTKMNITHDTLAAALQFYLDKCVFRDEEKQVVKIINQKLDGTSGKYVTFDVEMSKEELP